MTNAKGEAQLDRKTYEKLHWKQIETVFYSCLELPLEQRIVYLSQATKGDPQLFDSVVTLLQQSDNTLSFNKPINAATAAFYDQPNDLVGKRLGNYRLISLIDRGGMGDVYLAQRDDEQFDKQVAIKVIRAISEQPDSLERFKNERQILANLEHANIARLLDGGKSDNNQPYLVMEYVQGIPIDEYCQKHCLSLNSRLRLFQKICNAVSYAHKNLVIHCDLKPSNILVTQDGEPKLLDFGIASLLSNSNIQAEDLEELQASRRVSLQYSSPEQLRGQSLNIQSDVYSLGVVLYELICGLRPYQRNVFDMSAAIENPTTAARPSDQLSAANTDETRLIVFAESLRLVRKKLRFDVDYIVLKAIHLSPAERYESVSQFSQDIDRALTRLPVVARPSSWRYRGHAFWLRNSLATSLVSIFIVCLVSFSLITWQQKQQVAFERDQVSMQRDRAQAVTDFVISMLSNVDPAKAQGEQVTVREVLDNTHQQLDQNDALQRHPAVDAQIRFMVGRLYRVLGIYPLAQSQLEQSIDLFEQANLALTTEAIRAKMELSNTYSHLSKFKQSIALLKVVVEQSHLVNGPNHPDTLGAMNNYAGSLMEQGQLEAAKSLMLDLYQRRVAVLGVNHKDIINSISNLGVVNHWLGDYAEAKMHYERCLEASKSALGTKNPVYLMCLSLLGSVLEASGQYQLAEPVIRQHIELATKVFGEKHPEVLRSQHNLADTLRGLGRLKESRETFEQTLAARSQILGEKNAETLQSQMKLARVLLKLGDYSQAKQTIQSMWEVHSTQFGDQHPVSLVAQRILADVLSAQGEFTMSNEHYHRLQTYYSSLADPKPEHVNVMSGLSLLHLTRGSITTSLDWLNQAIQLAELFEETRFTSLLDALTQHIHYVEQPQHAIEPALVSQVQALASRVSNSD